MPQTKAALDSLLPRLLRTESLSVILVAVLAATEALGEIGTISVATTATALAIGRSLVKALGRG